MVLLVSWRPRLPRLQLFWTVERLINHISWCAWPNEQCSSHRIVRIERIVSCAPEAFRDDTTDQKGKHLIVNVIGFVPKGKL